MSLFRGLLVALLAAAAVVAGMLVANLIGWARLRRRGTPLDVKTYLAMRSRGVPVDPVAKAHGACKAVGIETAPEIWASFALLGVDVVKLASAVVIAARDGLEVGVGQLGAAAMSGYDPLDVVHAAVRRGMTQFAGEDLNALDRWDIGRRDEPV